MVMPVRLTDFACQAHLALIESYTKLGLYEQMASDVSAAENETHDQADDRQKGERQQHSLATVLFAEVAQEQIAIPPLW